MTVVATLHRCCIAWDHAALTERALPIDASPASLDAGAFLVPNRVPGYVLGAGIIDWLTMTFSVYGFHSPSFS